MFDAETRQRVQREARRLFAERGYKGASVRAITDAANANLGAITYYFGSKDALYRAVLDTVFGELARRIEAAAVGASPAPDRLRAIVRALFAFFQDMPDAPHLILHQIATGGGIPGAALPFLRRNLEAIRAVVTQGVAVGELRPVDPMLVAFTIISQSVWFAIAGRELSPILGAVPAQEQFATRVEQHVAEVVARFVTKEGARP